MSERTSELESEPKEFVSWSPSQGVALVAVCKAVNHSVEGVPPVAKAVIAWARGHRIEPVVTACSSSRMDADEAHAYGHPVMPVARMGICRDARSFFT